MTLDARQVIRERRTVKKPLSIADKIQAAFAGIPDNVDENGKHKVKYEEHLGSFFTKQLTYSTTAMLPTLTRRSRRVAQRGSSKLGQPFLRKQSSCTTA